MVFVFLDGSPLWLRRMNAEPLFEALFTWLRETVKNGAAVNLPSELAERCFSWTGGGPGPAPPIQP